MRIPVTRVVDGTYALALVGAVVLLGAAQSSAAAPPESVPKGFCPAMTKAAAAGEVLVVHPGTVAANREQLAALTASNLLGQHAPAIASTEAEYMEMWAQDAIAMLHHEGSSSAESKLHTKATVVLEKLDTDLKVTCPGSAEAINQLLEHHQLVVHH
jgi:PPE-repeat protein